MDNLDNKTPTPATASDTAQRIAPLKFEPQTARRDNPRPVIRRRTAIIGALLVMCTAIAWFILTAKAVYIDTDPKSSRIRVDAIVQLKLADRYLLRSGDYPITIQAQGYYPVEQQLSVGNEQSQQVSFALQRLPGHLRVNSGSLAGAQVFVDDALKGETPVLISALPHGEYRVRVSAERYFTFTDTVNIEGLGQEQTLSVEMRPAWADVEFASGPTGAEVFVDDESVGKTPLTTQILEGRHAVRVKLRGHKVWHDDITVTASEPMRLTDIELELADAVVFLVSDPPRANTTVDGEYKGLTPLELALVPGKQTTIRLFKQGYKPASRTLTAGSGDEQRLDVSLAPELATVEFKVSPADAQLYIDGKLRGAAQQTLQLSARSHRVAVRKTGFVDYETKITPRSGIPQQVTIELKTLHQAKLDKVKPIIKTRAGQSLKLFYPFGITMGASRREPGRKANETLRSVELKRPFYIGQHEVTNKQYRLFDKAHTSGAVQSTSLDEANQPVVKVTWEQAARYCNWLSKSESLPLFYREKDGKIVGFDRAAAGYRLPTEAEWGMGLTRGWRQGLAQISVGQCITTAGQ